MNKKYHLRDAYGKFYVAGKGFVATKAADASAFDNEGLKCLATAGFNGTPVEAITSYAVVYIRKGEGLRLLSGGYKNPADASKGQLDPSKRRFAEYDEAVQHGSRFRARRKDRADKSGTAEHEGFFVITTSDPVNAAVNWKTGLTNPIKA